MNRRAQVAHSVRRPPDLRHFDQAGK